MKRFPILFTTDLFNWLTGNQQSHGFETTSSFIRHIIIRFKKQETTSRWTDADMKLFAKEWHRDQIADKPPGVLENEERQMERQFSEFIKARL